MLVYVTTFSTTTTGAFATTTTTTPAALKRFVDQPPQPPKISRRRRTAAVQRTPAEALCKPNSQTSGTADAAAADYCSLLPRCILRQTEMRSGDGSRRLCLLRPAPLEKV